MTIANEVGKLIASSGRFTAINWSGLRGQTFDGGEAREASDFSEVIFNIGMTPDEAYDMFMSDKLSLGKRLFLAETISFDKATLMLLLDSDERIGAVINSRLKEFREKENGGIITG
jgi:hypothetical protein